MRLSGVIKLIAPDKRKSLKVVGNKGDASWAYARGERYRKAKKCMLAVDIIKSHLSLVSFFSRKKDAI